MDHELNIFVAEIGLTFWVNQSWSCDKNNEEYFTDVCVFSKVTIPVCSEMLAITE